MHHESDGWANSVDHAVLMKSLDCGWKNQYAFSSTMSTGCIEIETHLRSFLGIRELSQICAQNIWNETQPGLVREKREQTPLQEYLGKAMKKVGYATYRIHSQMKTIFFHVPFQKLTQHDLVKFLNWWAANREN